MTSIDDFVRRHLVPTSASLVDLDLLDIETDIDTSTWRTPMASAPLVERGPDTLGRDLRDLWSGRPELVGLVEPLVALCHSLGLKADHDLGAGEIDGGQYTLF